MKTYPHAGRQFTAEQIAERWGVNIVVVNLQIAAHPGDDMYAVMREWKNRLLSNATKSVARRLSIQTRPAEEKTA